MAIPDPTAVISFEEARRAYYIDFEGSKDAPPALLGWLYAEGREASEERMILRHDILDPELEAVVGEQELEGPWTRHDQTRRSIGVSMNDLARRAKAQKRLIVSWSQHEGLKIGEAELSPALQKMFETRFRDGKATAKRWLRHRLPESVLSRGQHTLTVYADLSGYDMPSYYELGTTAQKIARVRSGLGTRGSFEGLVKTQKDAWADVLLHNAVDLLALRHIVMHAASELEKQ